MKERFQMIIARMMNFVGKKTGIVMRDSITILSESDIVELQNGGGVISTDKMGMSHIVVLKKHLDFWKRYVVKEKIEEYSSKIGLMTTGFSKPRIKTPLTP